MNITVHRCGGLERAAVPRPAGERLQVVAAAIDVLMQSADLLADFPAEGYTRKLPVVFNASIGAHIRHCLDHFASVLRAADSGEVNYDHRERDKRIEADPIFAHRVTRRICSGLARLSPASLQTGVTVRCEVRYGSESSPVTVSTLDREIVYCIAHAIHHFALISVMARLMDIDLPPHFGVAPSTVAHQKRVA